jgi:16S rRNA (cytosine967-C5)-methyltransferase
VYGVLRRRGTLDFILSAKTRKPLSKISSRLRNLLRIGAYQILYLSKTPDSAAVDESVKLARALGGKPVAGFVNAVLREIARRPDVAYPDLREDPVAHIAARYSHPAWLVSRWVGRYGAEEAIRICNANNEPAPLTVRVNRLRTDREALSEALAREGVRSEPCRISPVGLRLHLGESGRAVSDLTAFRGGLFYVQDEAAQLVGLIAAPQPGQAVLDACAAPGGKTTHLAEMMENRGRITALDPSGVRLKRLAENAARMGATCVEPLRGDAATRIDRLRPASFDLVLVDAPCSGLGVLRRNPEGKWTKTEALIFRCRAVQIRILRNVAPLLKPGGILVYSTCTTEPEENEQVVDAFRTDHPGFETEDPALRLPETASGRITGADAFNSLLNADRMDSFFAVRMIRKTG